MKRDRSSGKLPRAPESERALVPSVRVALAERRVAAAISELVDAKVEERAMSAAYVDQTTSPLGRRRHCELARAKAFPARKIGGRWLARSSDVEHYIQTHGKAGREDDPESLDALVAGMRTSA